MTTKPRFDVKGNLTPMRGLVLKTGKYCVIPDKHQAILYIHHNWSKFANREKVEYVF